MSSKQLNMSAVNIMCHYFMLILAATPLWASPGTWNWGKLESGRVPPPITFNFRQVLWCCSDAALLEDKNFLVSFKMSLVLLLFLKVLNYMTKKVNIWNFINKDWHVILQIINLWNIYPDISKAFDNQQ